MMRVREALAGAALCAAIAVPAGAQPLFDLQKVADGVYAALATPRSPINCNAAVVVLDDAVLVVDTHSRPSSAKALIAQIRTITDKPVRFAVNTHFHWDHAQGNHAYPVAFPKQVAIVASEATRENLRTLGGARLKDQLANTPGQIAALEAQLAKATDAAAQARLKDEIAQQKDYLAEIKSLELTLPDLTFDKSLIIHRGDRRDRAAVPRSRAHGRRHRGVAAEGARDRDRRSAARLDAVHGRQLSARVGGDARRARQAGVRPHHRRARHRQAARPPHVLPQLPRRSHRRRPDVPAIGARRSIRRRSRCPPP